MSQAGGLRAVGPRGQGASTPFVPRPELEDSLRAAFSSGSGAVVLGEAGMGKSRLVHHVTSGVDVLAVRCEELQHLTAQDVVGGLLQGLDPAPSDLVRLLRGGSAGAGGQADLGMLLRASGHRLAAVIPPVTLVVDDAELLPDEEIGRLTLVMSVSERVWVFASRRPLNLKVPVVQVPPLQPAEATQLVDALLPGASDTLRSAVLERGGDSPLFLEQCAQLLLENGSVQGKDGRLDIVETAVVELPSSMRTFVDHRLDLLEPDESHVLSVAAVLGAQPELALLRYLSGTRSPAISRLVRRSLLREGKDASGEAVVRFSHALVREAAYERVDVADKVAIHKAAAEWYAVLPISQVLESQARHLEAAAALTEPDCETLRKTVEAMVLYARSIEEERSNVAYQVLARARALADARAECEPDLLQLELALASVSYIAGREPETAEAATRALALAEERGEMRGVAEAHLQLGRVCSVADPEAAERHFALSREAYRDVDDPGGLARVEIADGYARQYAEGIPQQLESMERAYRLAVRSADTRLQAMCAQQLAAHHAMSTGRPAFTLWAQRARDMSRRDDLGLEPRLALGEAALAMWGLDAGGGREAAGAALTAGRDLGLRDVYVNGLVCDIDLAVVAGDTAAAEAGFVEARALAATRPTDWPDLQLDLLEARLRARQGDQGSAQQLLTRVAEHELAANKVLRRDLAEARAWIAMERGSFREARALAAEAVGIDQEQGERCSQLRPRLVELVSTVALNHNVALGTIAELKNLAAETGLPTVVQLALRWLYVEELTQGWDVDLHSLRETDLIECRALDLEIEALQHRRYRKLLEAAEVWSELGVTIWRARALLWYSELTRMPARGVDDLLAQLQAPEGVARELRAQVAPLKR